MPKANLGNLNIKRILILLLCLIALVGAGGTYFFYAKYNAIKANPNLEAQRETNALVSVVGKLMELPKNETPTVATISDLEKLKDQPFFKMAKNGDKLLAYNTTMTAILYRPSINKIINVAPITINQSPNPSPVAQTAPVPAPTPSALRIAYYNGTSIVGLSGTFEKSVQAKFPDYQTAVIDSAARKDYTETIIVDLSGTHGKEAADLAELVNGKVGSLPDGEKAPDADILIIAGK